MFYNDNIGLGIVTISCYYRMEPEMEFKQIEAFISVVKYKSFSRAADASFLTQPTISAHISSLERELGVLLINRMGRESLPTKEGKLFYQYALDLLHTREEATRAIHAVKDDVAGILEIQASSIMGQYLVPRLMAGFQKQNPQVRYYLEQSDSGQVLKNINDYKGELGFVGYRPKDNLAYHFLCHDVSVVITPKLPRYMELLGKGTVKLSEFTGEPFIWRESGSATRRIFEEQCKERGFEIKALATMTSIEAIKASVSQGMGISVLSKMAVQKTDADEGYLVFEIEEADFGREFYMVHKKNIALSPVAAAFKEFTLKYYQAQ